MDSGVVGISDQVQRKFTTDKLPTRVVYTLYILT